MAARVASQLATFDSVSTPRQAREAADELARTIVSLYGAGLARVLDLAYDAVGDRGDALVAALVADPFVESLLCLHDLHPLSLEDRVGAALDAVRPYLKSHEGGVEIAAIEGDVVFLRMQGSCDGCPSSTATVKLAVERAILERVPEIREVRALGIAPETSHLRIESDWVALDDLAWRASATGETLATHTVCETPVLFVAFDDVVSAYRDACPTCGVSLATATLARPNVACAACGGTFDAIHGGRASGTSIAHARALPVVRDGARVRISLPLGA